MNAADDAAIMEVIEDAQDAQEDPGLEPSREERLVQKNQ